MKTIFNDKEINKMYYNNKIIKKIYKENTLLYIKSTEPSDIFQKADYKVESLKKFNGTSDYIDTGMKPFNTNKNFSLAISFTDNNGATSPNKETILHCMHEENPWEGFVINRESNIEGVYLQGTYVNNTKITNTNGDTGYIIIIKNKNTLTWSYSHDGVNYSTNTKIKDYHMISESIILGAMQNTNGNKVRFWKGSLNKFYYWDNYILNSEDINKVKEKLKNNDTEVPNLPPYFEGIIDKYLEYGSIFDPKQGVRAIDPEDGEIGYIVEPSSINTNSPGEYILTYTAIDSKGLSTTVRRTVTVKKAPINNPPYFTGVEDIAVDYGSYFDLRNGVRAVDPEEGEINFTVTPITINTNISGVKTFTYSAKDSGGLTTEVTRRITVKEQITPPTPPTSAITDDDLIMTPQYPSISTSEKRGEFSRYVSSGNTSDLYTWYKIFEKVLASGRYKFSATISQQNPSKNNILGFSTKPDLYDNTVTFETNGVAPSIIYFGIKKNSSCLISDIRLEKEGEALPPRPPFIAPPIENIRETYVNQDDGREKTIIWTKGMKTAPKMGGTHPDFRRTALNGYITYDIGYTPNQGWYDANKDERASDDSLCFIAAATNSLYWWFDINKEYINRYFNEGGTIPKDPNGSRKQTLLNIINGERPQRRSNLWEYFHARYGGRNSGGFTDVVQDQFINGYWFDNPGSNVNWPLNSESNQGQRIITDGVDPNGGFFYNVFNIRKLTSRTLFNGQNLPEYTRIIKETLENGGIVCPSLYYALYGNSGHIITMWGAEFNTDDGSLSAIYVSDSDDAQKDETFGMERRVISTKDGEIKMTTQADGKGGAKVYELNTLMAGTEFWEAYFNK